MRQSTINVVNGSGDKIEEVFSPSVLTPELGLVDDNLGAKGKDALTGEPESKENIESEDFIDDEEDSSLTYVAIGAAVAALGYTAYSYWPAITAAVSSAITWTTSVAIPAISAFALTSTGMITGMAVLGILLFGAIAYMKMSNSKTPEEKLPPVRNEVSRKFLDMVNSLDDKEKNPAATKIQLVGRMYLAKNELAELKKDKVNNTAATKIQSVRRMYLAKKEVAELKNDASATTLPQANNNR